MSDIRLGSVGNVALHTEEKESLSEMKDSFKKKLTSSDGEALAKAYRSRDGKVGSKQSVESETIYDALGCVEPPYNLHYLAELYVTSAIHAAAIDAKVENTVGLGWQLKFSNKAERLRDKKAEASEESRDKLEAKLALDRRKLMNFINNELNQTEEFQETLNRMGKDLQTLGNGYLEIGRTVDGKIGYVGHIPATEIRVRKKRDGFVQLAGSDVIFFRNFRGLEPNPFKNDNSPNELIHFKNYSPTNQYYGVPEIVAALDELAGIKFASRYNLEYFENKAVPRFIIKVKNMNISVEQQANLLKFFETTTKGQSHRSVIVPITGGENSDITFEPVEVGKQEGSFGDYIDSNTRTILSRHRTPQNRLGASDGTSLAASRDSDKIFKESVCRPQQLVIEKKINRIVAELTDLFDFKLEEYSLTDEKTKIEMYESMIRVGMLVPDEARTEIGYSRRPDGEGDQPMDPRALAELSGRSDAATRAVNDAKVEATGNRQRTQERMANQPDSTNNPVGRNAKGEGPSTS